MGFLSPLLLGLGVLVAVPILLHLLQRQQGPRVVFPALRYLRRAEKDSARRVRLRQLLLLLLRAAALLLLALAAARPFLRTGGASHEPTAVAIILDNSLSSSLVDGERRVLDRLQQRALETLARATPDDRFWLVRAGALGDPVLPGDALVTADRVRATEPTAAAGDLQRALERAAAVLASGAEGRALEIHLLSDLQASNFRAPARVGDIPIVMFAPERELPPNRSVSAIEVGGGLAPIAGERSTVSVRVAGAPGDSVGVRLAVEDRMVAAGTAPVGSEVVLALPARAAGLMTGFVETDADALRADNRRYFAAFVSAPPTVSAAGASPFLNDALQVLADAGRIQRTGAGGAVRFAAGGAGVEGAVEGTVIVLPATSPLELPAVNRRLAAAGIPWRYEVRSGAGEARFRTPPADDAPLQTLAGVRLTEWYPLTRAGSATRDSVLLTLSDGTPWAVRGQRSDGATYILLGSPLTPEASTLPTGPAMLPLLDRLTGAWAARRTPSMEVEPGADVVLSAEADGLLFADSTRQPAAGTIRAPAMPGAYRVLAGERVIDAFVVNPAPAESDLTPLDVDRLEDLVDGRVVAADDADDWTSSIYRQRLGSESWRWLAVLALLLLLIEMAVAATGRLRRSRVSEEAVIAPATRTTGVKEAS